MVKIRRIKEGMTNDSHIIESEGKSFVIRLPGKGTEQLINRYQEQAVYEKIAHLKIADKVLFLDPENGYKITKFLNNTRTCDKYDWEQVQQCMDKLKILHHAKLKVDFTFDLGERTEFYASLMGSSKYEDYERTRTQIQTLQTYLTPREHILCHIDANPDNCLFYGKKQAKLKLIDWEYAAMQDPLVDLAMWSIYAMYSREDIDRLLVCYGVSTEGDKYRVYAYVAMCGLLWSNWCEYKELLGVSFGDYALAQYDYAKDYYQIFMDEWGKHV